ncbi:MAG: TetR/AcrR family transcriptional regulator [Hyphomonas sp.]|nr:TetR/AcrR family transcriptional regulator [Hyphomonas sp.]
MSNHVPETRDRILRACLKLLENSDGQEVRVSDVADEAGVTRQTLYLYFRNRAELLIATTQYLDELKNSDERLRPSRTAGSGKERLDAYITAWCDYVPEIYGASRALLAMNDADSQRAWSSRMQDMWEGCEAAIRALKRDGQLTRDYSVKEASDLLWTLLSVRNWENLRIERSWSQEQYLAAMMKMAHRLFVDE